jgi:hypothetical protein
MLIALFPNVFDISEKKLKKVHLFVETFLLIRKSTLWSTPLRSDLSISEHTSAYGEEREATALI